jgi:hypothetical protein
MNITKLDLQTAHAAVSGSAAAFRCRRRLQPAGGPGDKVFPPTFAGAVYAVEQRRVFGDDGKPLPEPKTCVVLDTVQSQANRMEQALQEAIDLLNTAIAAAGEKGLAWREGPTQLVPQPKLADLVRRSQREATKEEAGTK